MRTHPNDLRLEALYLANSREDQETLEHLGRCRRCRDRLTTILQRRREVLACPPGEELPPQHPAGGGGDPTFTDVTEVDRLTLTLALTLARERFEAPELLVELVRRPAGRRQALLEHDPRFRTWGVFELLIDRSQTTAVHDPEEAEELGSLALALSDRLDALFYGARRIEDLRARAWASVGNARRVRSDLQGAERAFEQASLHLALGTRDPLEEAALLDLDSSLRRDQRRFGEALELSRRAVDLFLEIGERHRAGRSLVKMSTIHYFIGDPERAIALLYQALDLVDGEEEPRLLLCARHNLIDDLAEIGRFEEARDLYRRNRSLYRDFLEPWVQNRRKWVKGKIARGLGQAGLAESLFLAARDGFAKEGVPYDMALVSLDLALLYADQGRTAELKRLAAEMLPVFSSLEIHREALAALAFLRQSIEAEQASLAAVKAVAGYLKRAQHDPDLRFQAPG